LILLTVSKKPDVVLQELITSYETRLKHYISYQPKLLKPSTQSAAGMIKSEESQLILKELRQDDYLILLDHQGYLKTSEELAQMIQKRLNDSSRRTVFCIGGAYGFHDSIYKRADFKLSLSQLTFPHQLCRLVFTEQLYRACTILRGEKYHHG
jgi:23S rRNA (pseudouridine1915-N3)-methyltransferase